MGQKSINFYKIIIYRKNNEQIDKKSVTLQSEKKF